MIDIFKSLYIISKRGKLKMLHMTIWIGDDQSMFRNAVMVRNSWAFTDTRLVIVPVDALRDWVERRNVYKK